MVVFSEGMHDISNNEYHSSSGVSRSQLMKLAKSPYHFWYEYMSGLAKEKYKSADMILGSAFHTLVLEPQEFESEFIVLPENLDRRTKEGKLKYDAIMQASNGKEIIKNEDLKKLHLMRDSLNKNKTYNMMISDAQIEKSIFWTDEETLLSFKCRPDAYSHGLVMDLKTTKSINVKNFKWSALDYGYYLQAGMMKVAFESLGMPFNKFAIVACEKDEPYCNVIYVLTNEAIDYGVREFNRLKVLLRDCLNNDKWPSYDVQELDSPEVF